MMARNAAAEPRPWKRAALWLLVLGALFFSSYNTANWLASQRANVPSIVFAWESAIPYWPWSIVPYWSIDLFYCVSLFICATKRELDTHARRLLAIQLISVTIFVLAPLRYTFMRPETSGVFGAMLDALLMFDKPFNQAPALHISLLIILWFCYAKHLSGAWRWLLHAWFALIGVSVLTTYQHHFFDIPTGLWAGWFCVWLFPDNAKPVFAAARFTQDHRRRQLALRYFAGAAVAAVVALMIGDWGLWLLWVTGALLLVSSIYACLDANAFQKGADGRLSSASQWLLAPYLLGAWLNSCWWTRDRPAANAVTPEVWIGRLASAADVPRVNTVVDLCAELPCPATAAVYVAVPALDLITLNEAQLETAAAAIARAVINGTVLVCCALGYSRSAAAVAAWLITSGRAGTAQEAVEQIRLARPQIVLSDAQCRALDALARARDH
jgi:protein-tyrosine phosphatase/membrane-associated phospholipid phosphatase